MRPRPTQTVRPPARHHPRPVAGWIALSLATLLLSVAHSADATRATGAAAAFRNSLRVGAPATASPAITSFSGHAANPEDAPRSSSVVLRRSRFGQPIATPFLPFATLDTGVPTIELGAVAWGDADADGLLDLLQTGWQNAPLARLYRNHGESAFAELTAPDLAGTALGSIAWTDYDNDGDLDALLSGTTNLLASGAITRLYRNEDGSLTVVSHATFPGVYESSAAWGDYDNDGRPDLLLTGQGTQGRLAQLWHNDGDGAFTQNTNAPLPGVSSGAAAWGDLDNDGWLDFLLTGSLGGTNDLGVAYQNLGDGTFRQLDAGLPRVRFGSLALADCNHDGQLDVLVTGLLGSATRIARVYRNNGNLTFTELDARLPGILHGGAAWGDYDNDGWPDILLAGTSEPVAGLARVYRNNRNESFAEIDLGLPSIGYRAPAWGDFDRDGRLDILLAGGDADAPFATTALHRNRSPNPNLPPTAPSGLRATVSDNFIRFDWSPATDDHTPPPGLTYNLRVGLTPGGQELCSALVNQDGQRLLPQMGNAQHGLTALLRADFLRQLTPDQTVYWSVQAIDASFAAGPFATDQSFRAFETAPLRNAWQISDTTPDPGTALYYSASLTPDQLEFARNNGWRYSVVSRLADAFSGAPSMQMAVDDGFWRFAVAWTWNADGDLLAVPANAGQPILLTRNGAGADQYHTHLIEYLPQTGTATYRFDGRVVATLPGEPAPTQAPQVRWGANAPDGTGQMNFHQVRFEIPSYGVPIEYDAGTDATLPEAPDPAARGWTRSTATAGISEQELSPDLGILQPHVSTSPAARVVETSAQLRARINPHGFPTVAWFEWGVSPETGTATLAVDVGDGSAAVDHAFGLGGLLPGNLYVYVAVASNRFGVTRGLPHPLLPAGLAPPSILEHPESIAAQAGDSFPLCVVAAGESLAYQWRKNGANIPDATGPCLEFPPVTPKDAGKYTVVVANAAGARISEAALVTVETPTVQPGDNFADRLPLRGLAGTVSGDNRAATAQPNEPFHDGNPPSKSLWFTWHAPADAIVTLDTAGSQFDTVVAVYTGAKLAGLEPVVSNDDAAKRVTSVLVWNAAAGTDYHIALDGDNGAAGAFTLGWNAEPTPQKLPVILEHPRSLTVRLGTPATFSVVAAGSRLTYQWFFAGRPLKGATKPQFLIERVDKSHLGPYHVVVSSGPRSISSRSAMLTVDLRPGKPIVSDKLGGAKRSPGLVLGPKRRLALNSSTEVEPVLDGAHLFSTADAIGEPDEPLHCGVPGGASAWFKLVPQVGGTLRLSTDGSDFDTVLAVYAADTAGLASLTPLACDDNSGPDGVDSLILLPVEAGATYYAAVDGVDGTSGVVELRYRLITPLALAALDLDPDGSVRLRLTGAAERTVTIEASDDLRTWSALATLESQDDELEFLDPAPAGHPHRFYRARSPAP